MAPKAQVLAQPFVTLFAECGEHVRSVRHASSGRAPLEPPHIIPYVDVETSLGHTPERDSSRAVSRIISATGPTSARRG